MSGAGQETEAEPSPTTPRPAEQTQPPRSRLDRVGQLYVLALVLWVGVNAVTLMDLIGRPFRLFAFIKLTYDLNTLYIPPLFLLTALAGWRETVRRPERRARRLRRGAMMLLALGLGLAGARVWATHIEPRLLKVRHVRVASAKLDRPLRILHVSDIQSPAVGGYEARAFGIMAGLAPDLVIHTGDMLQPLPPATEASEWPKIERLWAGLKAPLGIWAVDGDTDGAGLAALGAGPAQVRLLEGEAVTIQFGRTRLRLLGLGNEMSHDHGAPMRRAIGEWLAGTQPGDLTILAGHCPNFALVAREFPIDLCLAGHTHGGQIRLPWIGPLMTLSKVPNDWARGFRTVGRTRLNVSAGIGGEHLAGLPTIRINCPPEMTLIEVRPAAEESGAGAGGV